MSKYAAPQADTFLERMDRDFQADGELSRLSYMSCINYAVRRLISIAEHYRRRYDPELFEPSRHRLELRKFLRGYTGYGRYGTAFVEELVSLLAQCLQEADRDVSPGVKNRMRQEAQQRDLRCYMCGRTLNHDRGVTESNSASVDHSWPHSLGGSSDQHNLRIACRECDNSLKQDYMDASDYHYEEIALGIGTYVEYQSRFKDNQRWRARSYETAVFAKAEFRCAGCDTPAFRLGELQIGRRDLDDGWHFLNLTAYCASCSPEEQLP